MPTKTKKRSVEKQLKEMLDIFSDKNAWIQGAMAVKDAEKWREEEIDTGVSPKSKEAQAFCFVGAARRVGDGLELLSELTQSVVNFNGFEDLELANPFVGFNYDTGVTTAVKPSDKDDLEEIMISFNDSPDTSVADIRRLIQSALKRVQKTKEKK